MAETPAPRALVVGSHGGIGSACVHRLRAHGWQVVGVDRDDGIDVTLPGGAEAAVERACDDVDALDAIVHAVGMSGRGLGDGPVTSCTDEAWTEVHRVNLESVFRLLRCGLPTLRTGGAFVTVGSVLARATDQDFLTAAYAASKGALEALTRVAARQMAPQGVRVNLVAAGLVATPMAHRALTDDHIKDRLQDLQPLGAGPLQPEDVAEAVAWLLSDAARRVTGVVLPVDAGWSLR